LTGPLPGVSGGTYSPSTCAASSAPALFFPFVGRRPPPPGLIPAQSLGIGSGGQGEPLPRKQGVFPGTSVNLGKGKTCSDRFLRSPNGPRGSDPRTQHGGDIAPGLAKRSSQPRDWSRSGLFVPAPLRPATLAPSTLVGHPGRPVLLPQRRADRVSLEQTQRDGRAPPLPEFLAQRVCGSALVPIQEHPDRRAAAEVAQ
jgi:hypothetical protein